jgi:hypothetical protein
MEYWRSARRLTILVACVVAGCTSACTGSTNGPDQTKSVEKAFPAGGRIGVQIDKGDCEIVRAAGERILVTLHGNIGNATAEVNTSGTDASVLVKDPPSNNFHCTIEVPKADQLTIRLGGGNLTVANIAATTDVQNGGGNTEIVVGDASEYGSVDASVGVGDLGAEPFGHGQSGISPHLTWSGSGKRTLTAHVGAGNLTLKK